MPNEGYVPEHQVEVKLTEALEAATQIGNEVNFLRSKVAILESELDRLRGLAAASIDVVDALREENEKQEGVLGVVIMTLTKDSVEYDDIRYVLKVVGECINPETPA